jgi:nitrate reductase NapAB chaperone NapD
MPISGVLLTCRQDGIESVCREIEERPGVEVRKVEGRMVVAVTDTSSLEEDRREVQWLESLSGVLSALVTFTNVEDLAETASPGGTP